MCVSFVDTLHVSRISYQVHSYSEYKQCENQEGIKRNHTPIHSVARPVVITTVFKDMKGVT